MPVQNRIPKAAAWGAHGDVKFPIRAEMDEFPSMAAIGGQAVVDHKIGGVGCQVVDRVVEPDHPVNLCHI